MCFKSKAPPLVTNIQNNYILPAAVQVNSTTPNVWKVQMHYSSQSLQLLMWTAKACKGVHVSVNTILPS